MYQIMCLKYLQASKVFVGRVYHIIMKYYSIVPMFQVSSNSWFFYFPQRLRFDFPLGMERILQMIIPLQTFVMAGASCSKMDFHNSSQLCSKHPPNILVYLRSLILYMIFEVLINFIPTGCNLLIFITHNIAATTSAKKVRK